MKNKKNRNNPPITKGSRLNITLCYVNIATGLWLQVRNFFYTQRQRIAFLINKCEAGGAFLHNEMTLRSMGNGMTEKILSYRNIFSISFEN
jgi:hypothetical protein